jgi:hypothetical protein
VPDADANNPGDDKKHTTGCGQGKPSGSGGRQETMAAAAQQAHDKTMKIDGLGTLSLCP